MESRALVLRAVGTSAPLTRGQRIAFTVIAVAVAITRWLSISRSLWDLDEALFVLAMRDYNVDAYHPHPPGFPLFIAAAKLVPFLDEFRALQAIAVLASLCVFPAAFFLARELRASAFVSIGAGLLLAFSPNVWFFGGTAFSDVPSLVLVLIASTLLLRGCRSPRALIAGAVVLGIAAGFRPQNLLIGFVPLLLAIICQRRVALIGLVIIVAIVAVSYGSAAALSGGLEQFADRLQSHESYIRRTDSFLAPKRPSLLKVADDFFLRPYRAPVINVTIALLAAVALVRRKSHTLLALAIFGPFLLFAWLFLDFHSASRFSIAYMPLFAILAADGLDALRKARAVGLAVVTAMMIAWTWPALRVVHTTDSPPAAAARWIREHMDPVASLIYVDHRLVTQAEALLPQYERHEAESYPPAIGHERARAVWLTEASRREPGAQTFARDPGRLGGIARRRYFVTSIVPLRRIGFGEGWYGEEGPPAAPFRWMAGRSRAILPPSRGPARLTLRFISARESTIEIRVDGRLIDRFRTVAGPSPIEKSWRIEAGRELVIETDRVTRAPGDPRDLGLRLEWIDYLARV